MSQVAITGMGIVSAIGHNIAETWQSLGHSRSGLVPVHSLDSIHKGKLKVGEVTLSDDRIRDRYGIPKDAVITRAGLLAIAAISEAQEMTGGINEAHPGTALVSATSIGGMDMKEKYFKAYPFNDDRDRYIISNNPGYTTRSIADHFRLDGLVTTISTACSSAANAIMMAARLIQSGKADRVIAGGTDALAKFTLNGFRTLMILTDTENAPFDAHRRGLNLGEGAAYLILESERSLAASRGKVLAYLSGYANANDAHHQTASSEDGKGAYLAMRKALEAAGLQPGEIDYINVHGTATENNDLTEGRAMNRIFKGHVPPFSSTKPFTGHTLAAAGGLEAVFSILSLQHQAIPASLNFREPIEGLNLNPNTAFKGLSIDHVLSNSFGFGGNCSSLIFSRS